MAHFPEKDKYPFIGRIVHTDLPKIINDPQKFNAFKKYGGFSDKEARETLKANSLVPEISLTDHLGAHGWGHYPSVGNVVLLSKTIADQYDTIVLSWRNSPEYSRKNNPEYSALSLPSSKEMQEKKELQEKIDRWKFTIETARRHIEATILHEMVHWGDLMALGEDGKRDLKANDYDKAHRKGWSDLGHLFVNEAYGDKIKISTFRSNRRKHPRLPSGTLLKQSDVGIKFWLGWDKNNHQPF